MVLIRTVRNRHGLLVYTDYSRHYSDRQWLGFLANTDSIVWLSEHDFWMVW